MRRVTLVLPLLVAAATAGCGGGARRTAAPPAVSAQCRSAASLLVEDGRRFLEHYDGLNPGPADQELYNIRNDLARLQRGRCAPAQVGRALRGGLTAKDARRLASLAPRPIELNVRQALRCSATGKASSCGSAAARFTETSFGPGATNYPIAP